MGDISVRTTCPYCGVGCGVLAATTNDGAVAISGDTEHPANFGRLCSKGSALGETLELDDRLLHPIVDGKRASWDAALDLVAGRFSRRSTCSAPSAMVGSRRSGSWRPTPTIACRRPTMFARRWRHVRSSSFPTSRATPIRRHSRTFCCLLPDGARRTAPSPIRSAASRGNAPFCPPPAKRDRTGGSSPRSASVWPKTRVGPRHSTPRPLPKSSASMRG